MLCQKDSDALGIKMLNNFARIKDLFLNIFKNKISNLACGRLFQFILD